VNSLRPFTHRRPAFTLLETVLAAVMGSMFVLLTVGFMYAMQRSDLAMARRAEEAGDLQRARLVMQRCFSSILTSDQPRPDVRGLDRRRNAARGRTPDAKQDAKQADAEPESEPEGAPPPPPRIILATQDGRAAPPIRLASGEWAATTPQRLELVVFESPVPKPVREFRGSVRQRRAPDKAAEVPAETVAPGELVELDGAETTDEDEPAEEDDTPLKAIRGALELRPRLLTNADLTPDTARPSSYDLWWVPIPRRAPANAVIDEALQLELATIDRPYKVASNIAMARWVMYDDKEKKTNFEATWEAQLPAYIECQIETTTGLRSEWMFEVGWGVGPEVRLPKQDENAAGGKSGENRAVPVDGSGTPSTPGSSGSPAPSGSRGSPGSKGGGGSKGGK